MKRAITNLSKNLIKITFELSPEDVQPYLEDAAKRISEAIKIPGFRPGHAPYKTVAKNVGEMKILEEAVEPIIKKSFVEAVLTEKIETLGSPKIDIEKMAPGNALIFSATVALMPKTRELASYNYVKVEKKTLEVSEDEINKVLEDLRKIQTRENRINRPITNTDRVVLNMDIFKDAVAIEGGATSDHGVFMDEPYYIPGFTDSIIGLKEGDEKAFFLAFPETHYNKILAGKTAEFKVKINEIYARECPEIDDDFAKNLGKNTISEVKALLKENILKEKAQKESDRIEIELLNQLVKESKFDEFPDLLTNEEINRMIYELKHGISEQGIPWEDYLKQINKSEADLKIDFAARAIERIKTALVVKEIAKKEKISVDDTEIDAELDKIAEYYKDDENTKQYIYSPEYRDEAAKIIQNRKTIKFLRNKILAE